MSYLTNDVSYQYPVKSFNNADIPRLQSYRHLPKPANNRSSFSHLQTAVFQLFEKQKSSLCFIPLVFAARNKYFCGGSTSVRLNFYQNETIHYHIHACHIDSLHCVCSTANRGLPQCGTDAALP